MTETTGMTDTGTVEILDGREWTRICDYEQLTPGRGVAALSAEGQQVAVFRDRSGAVYAVDNRDPFSGAYVLSRGILGSRAGVPTVSSPMYKQVFDLRDGRCLDEETAPDGRPAVLRVWPVRIAQGSAS
ncbi:nitrite reductase small subunit NirD [Kitasatospora acidiphila]|uniref:Nitrite reductase small subunit NirD n=1 Tax=Kitasatospora acidiphila TaxID=2567942 RepID=A0A540WG88_9ACTN|nr:nitrite reductase small subunit NirD [Kitasatospora acidiphila]TQF08041.1 nitrite reductase small subunit NirD [Kitasatospora acidiphila]